MKLQHMTIIFLAIIVPMILILSAYIRVQSKSIGLQNQYDTKLIDATHDAIIAFELNTSNNKFSTISNSIRRDILASAKTFANSVATNSGITGTDQKAIMKYIPALLYTLYDGYYIYAPVNDNGTYEHELKSYIYYSGRYKKDNTDVVINYSLDNYIAVEGIVDGKYVSKSGYLINLDRVIVSSGKIQYYNTKVGNVKVDEPEQIEKYDENGNLVNNSLEINTSSMEYYQNAYEFTSWLMSTGLKNITPSDVVGADGKQIEEFKTDSITRMFNINNANDPEDQSSDFNQHRKKIIRLSIAENLNNAIANYNRQCNSMGVDYNFKMPILSDEDWDKITNNVTLTTFMQGVPVGTSIYNNYAIAISTKNNIYANPNQIYFTNGSEYYHKLNCPDLLNDASENIVGYKSATFSKTLSQSEEFYYYPHPEYACYYCLVDSQVGDVDLSEIKNDKSLSEEQKLKLMTAYYKALGRIKKETYKVSDYINN